MALGDEVAFAEHLASLLADLDATSSAMSAGGPRRRPGGHGGALGTGAGRHARRSPPPDRGRSDPVGHRPDEQRFLRLGTVDGDVGPWPGRRRRARTRPPGHGAGCATWPTSAWPPGPSRSAIAPSTRRPEPYVELTGPAGERWAWGDPAAAESVRGPAVDLCLVVTQRRHVDDTALEASGDGGPAVARDRPVLRRAADHRAVAERLSVIVRSRGRRGGVPRRGACVPRAARQAEGRGRELAVADGRIPRRRGGATGGPRLAGGARRCRPRRRALARGARRARRGRRSSRSPWPRSWRATTCPATSSASARR